MGASISTADRSPEVVAGHGSLRILTTRGQRGFAPWTRATTLLQPRWPAVRTLFTAAGKRESGWPNVLLALELARARRSFDVLVTGNERGAHMLALADAFWPGRRRPHVMMGCLWQRPTGRLALWLRRLRYQLEARSVSRFIVWSRRQADHYARVFGLPPEKIAVVPFHTTLDGFEYRCRDEGYVFSGGDSQRDYQTFIEAIRPLDCKVKIAALSRRHFAGMDMPAHVEVVSTTEAGFRDLMAGARIVVIPMQGGLIHSGGYQTYLNAMAMGKPVVVCDDVGVFEYIENGVDGFITEPGDVGALRGVLDSLLKDEALRTRVAEAGRATAKRFSAEKFIERILAVVHECARPAHGA